MHEYKVSQRAKTRIDKKGDMKRFFLGSILIAIIMVTLAAKVNKQDTGVQIQEQYTKEYLAKQFDFSAVAFLTPKQCEQHYGLYKGYVAKLNEIQKKLITAQRSPGITYSEYRALKIAQTFALNGVLLHELYFENIVTTGDDNEVGARFKELMIASFGSQEAYLRDLRDAAACARGWAVTGYNMFDGTITNYVLDAHNETVPVMVIPLVVVDVYEHAYMIDFGTARAHYLDGLLASLNWQVIEERTTKALAC